MVAWQRKFIPLDSTRRFHTPFGEDIRSPLCVDLGGNKESRDAAACATNSETHTPGLWAWYDGALARAWFRRANTLARDRDAIAKLSTGPWNPALVPDGYKMLARQYLQNKYVFDIVEAVSNGYDALNVPQYMHQRSREMYWTYMSGPPGGTGGAAMFNPVQNWTGEEFGWGWYMAHRTLPIITDRSRGIIPRMSRSLFLQRMSGAYAGVFGVTRRNEFMQTVGIGISIPGYNRLPQHKIDELQTAKETDFWYYNRSIRNKPFVLAQNMSDAFCSQPGRDPLAYPFNCSWTPATEGWIVANEASHLGAPESPIGAPPMADDWRMFRGDFGPTAVPDPEMRVSMGSYHYLTWLAEWSGMLVQLTPEEIILSVREFATYMNFKTLNADSSANTSVISEWQQMQRGDPTLQAIGSTAAALGAALSGVTYGISAVVGAAIAATISIYDSLPNANKITAARDDLGRYKSVIDRAWLAGNPGYDTLDAAPSDLTVPAVPTVSSAKGNVLSFFTPQINIADVVQTVRSQVTAPTTPTPTAPTTPTPSTAIVEEPPSSSSGMKTALIVGGVAIAAFAGYKVLSSRKK